MTPRSLLTAIGATALAFAVAIGVAAGTSTGVSTSESGLIAFAAPAEQSRVGGAVRSNGEHPSDERLAVRNDPCAIAM